MKAITLYQPWAHLVAQGVKIYETRSWPPPSSLIGERIAIHAGKRFEDAEKEVAESCGFDEADMAFGAIVCTALLVAVHEIKELVPQESVDGTPMNPVAIVKKSTGNDPHLAGGTAFLTDRHGNYAPGRFAWRLRAILLVSPPVPARGWQGLWEMLPEVTRSARRNGG